MSRSTACGRRLGWIPDLPDRRDLEYCPLRCARFGATPPLPDRVDLSAGCGPVYDQGGLGSCTANAIAGALAYNRHKQGAAPSMASRLFIYFNERQIEGTTDSDAGAMIRDGIKSVARQGACEETLWPYIEKNFRATPRTECYRHALLHQVVSYQRLPQTLDAMRGCLAAGFPFVLGFSVYESFMGEAVARSGIVPLPGRGERMEGGHAVLCVGYSDESQCFMVRNSWGAWGKDGHCMMPYAYLSDPSLASDFWTIRSVEVPVEPPDQTRMLAALIP